MVFVLNKNKKPLSPCNNAVARRLLKEKKAVIHKRYPFTIRFNQNDSSMTVACFDGSIFRSVNVTGFPVNTWKQIVAVFDFVAKTLTVYRDGVSGGSASLVGINQVSNTSPIAIATRLQTNGAPQTSIMFKGSIGLIRIYSRNLTSDEVLQNFNSYKTKYGL
jgi:hypothetical protein